MTNRPPYRQRVKRAAVRNNLHIVMPMGGVGQETFSLRRGRLRSIAEECLTAPDVQITAPKNAALNINSLRPHAYCPSKGKDREVLHRPHIRCYQLITQMPHDGTPGDFDFCNQVGRQLGAPTVGTRGSHE